ncbi:cell division cycle- protein [Linnemannia schmuckeri]|uniref:M-phase inducer phosphatase n=1 Tax=Linnemannia schmuckeri TaxID=64567 RepID=A0A9P5VA07_9FUNG|nr:cell division cycle- protein [Linnemannia schmuckeri]
MSTHSTHQTKTTSEQSMPDNKISNTYTSIIKHPSTERPRPSSLDMAIKQTAQASLQTEPLDPLQQTSTPDIKRPQELLFDSRKKAKILLEIGHGKSVNHFSQSARVLQSRPQSTPSEQPLARSILAKSTLERPLSRLSAYKISTEAMTLAGKPRSKAPFSPLASSETSTSPAQSVESSVSTDSKPASTTKTTATAITRTLDHPRLSSHKSDLGSASLLPQPTRSLTFSGPVNGSESKSSKQLSADSPFSGSPFLSNGSVAKIPSSKTPYSTAKRLGRTQSLLRHTTLTTPFLLKLETNSPLPINKSSTLSEDTPWMQRRITNKDGKARNDTEPLDQESTDETEDDHIEEGTVEELQVGSALDSCTAAMTALSPPSAKVSKASISSSLRMLYQPSFVSLAPEATSLSLPNPDSGTTIHSLSDDDSHDHTSDEQPLRQDIVSRPQGSHKSHSSSSISTNTKRPIMWRRHQTMISSRSEFMKTLESNNVSTKKAVVIVSDSYIPDPLREECQILPSTDFITKPDDTTRRVSPKTVVDVLEGKYKDQYDLLHIIDCRFPYEFEGGHIKSAVNVNTTDELDKLLLQPATTDKRVLLIFHCEFSSKRAPRLARHLRNQDRAWNVSHYPALFYPEVYVMEGGYSSFFEENKSYCWPEAYVKM